MNNGRKCTVCAHKDRETIDKALVERKTGFRHLSSHWDVGYRSLCRHYEKHIPEKLKQSQRSKELVQGDNLVEEVKAWRQEVEAMFREAKEEKSIVLALQAIDRVQRLVELQARLIGMLKENEAKISITVNPEWIQLRGIILEAVEPHPEVKDKLIRAFGGVDVSTN